jgi:aminoglycoside phosphotransferase (APT) family kinase protein
MHEDQFHLTQATVRALVEDQFPAWGALPVREVRTAATVNAIFRIGDALAARFPLRPQDPREARAWLRTEADAARELAEVSVVPTPEPVAIGEPGRGYPLPWSIQTWLPGHLATDEDPADSVEFALDLAGFISALRAADTRGRRFAGSGRGGHLPDHDAWMDHCFSRSEGLLDPVPLRAMWAQLRTLPEGDEDMMCHGDLIPPNILVRDNRLVGVLDGGGFSPADPAVDLVGAWHLLDEAPRSALRNALNCSDLQGRRGMAWALQQAMGLVWYYVDSNPAMSHVGRRTLDRLLNDGSR